MDERSLNPVYFWLSENLSTEQAIAKQKKDLDSFALTLVHHVPAKELKTSFSFLYTELSKENFKIKHVIATSVLLYLSKKNRFHIKNEDLEQIKSVVSSLHSLRLPLKYKLIAHYFLKQYDFSWTSELGKTLLAERATLIQQNKLDDLLEVEFALGINCFSKQKWDAFDISSSHFDIGKLAKLGLLYKSVNNSQKIKTINNLVEEQVWEKISTTSLPTISLMVYEAEKLINTNLPDSELHDALDLLKKQNKNWTKLISKIQSEGVTVDLKNFSYISGLSSEDACWAIKLLDETDRQKTYQLSSQEYEIFTEFENAATHGALPITRYSVISFTLFISIIFVLSYIYFIERHGLSILVSLIENIKNWNLLWQNIKDTKISFGTVGEILTSPPIVLVITVSTLWRSWLYLSKEHKFGVRYALKAVLYMLQYK